MGAWAARHLDGDLFQIVAASHADDDAVDALQSGFLSVGGVGRRQGHDPRLADATEVDDAVLAARVSGARTVAVHAIGAVRDRDRAGRAFHAASAPSSWSTVSVPRTSPWPSSVAATAASTPPPPGAAPTPAAFGQEFRTATGHAADAFAAVGYDAAVLLDRGGAAARPRSSVVAAGRRAVGAVGDGSRGRMTVDVATGSANTPIVVRRSRAGRNVVVARRPLVSAPPPTMAFTMVGRSAVSYSDEATDA